LDAAVLKATSPLKEDRYPDAYQMHRGLEAACREAGLLPGRGPFLEFLRSLEAASGATPAAERKPVTQRIPSLPKDPVRGPPNAGGPPTPATIAGGAPSGPKVYRPGASVERVTVERQGDDFVAGGPSEPRWRVRQGPATEAPAAEPSISRPSRAFRPPGIGRA